MRWKILILLLCAGALSLWIAYEERMAIQDGKKLTAQLAPSPSSSVAQPKTPLPPTPLPSKSGTANPIQPENGPTAAPSPAYSLKWFDLPHDLDTWSEEAREILQEMDTLFGQAMDLDEKGKYAAAETSYKAILSLWADLPHQEEYETKELLGIVHNNLAASQMEANKFAEAEVNYQKALEIHRRLSGEWHKTVAKDLNNLGSLNEYQKKYAEAEDLYRQSLEIRERLFGRDHYEVAVAHANIGQILEIQGNLAEAEIHFRKSLEVRRDTLGNRHKETQSAAEDLASLYIRQSRDDEAQEVRDSVKETDR